MASSSNDPTRQPTRPRDLLLFAGITYLVSWGLWVVATLPGVSGAAEVGLVFVGAFGPTIAAVLLTWRADGRTGVRQLAGRVARWRVPFRWYVAVFVPVVTTLVAYVALRALAADVPPLGQFGNEVGVLVFLVIILSLILSGLIGGAIAEELGWRGYALPRLQHRFGATSASVLLGLLWAFWHLPLWFLPGLDPTGIPFEWYVPQVVAITVLMTWVFNNTRGSVLLAMLFHAVVNASTEFVVDLTIADPVHVELFGKLATITMIVAAVLVIGGYGRHRLSEPLWTTKRLRG